MQNATNKKRCWAILGGGNGGQALAGHLSMMGFTTRLYDIFKETTDKITEQGGVHLEGAVVGFGEVEYASTDLPKVLEGADAIMITATALAHAPLAKQCAPLLKDGQHVILHPGDHFGAIEFKSILEKEGCKADVTISETNSLIYACRALEAGRVLIYGIKTELLLGTLPANRTSEAIGLVQELFPQIQAAKNIIESSLANTNAILHPGPSVLCAALIESRHEWEYYKEGFTPTIGVFVERMDDERMAICEAYGIKMDSIVEWFKSAYGVDAKTLSEATRINPSYDGIKGQKRLDTRYIIEDIPMGLIPMMELAKLVNVPTPHMQAITNLGLLLLKDKEFPPARNFENLGLADISFAEFMHYVETGEKPKK